jgi:hypothetical protein
VGQDEILDGEAAESAHLVEEELCIVGAIEDDMDVGGELAPDLAGHFLDGRAIAPFRY